MYLIYGVQTYPNQLDANGNITTIEMVEFVLNASGTEPDSNIYIPDLNIAITFIKQIPASERTYDPINSYWTIKMNRFLIIQTLLSASNIVKPQNFIKVDNLTKWALLGRAAQNINAQFKRPVGNPANPKSQAYWKAYGGADYEFKDPDASIDEDDFFYSKTQPTTSASTPLASIEASLLALLGLSKLPAEATELTRCYRKAALRLHPDHNAGDGSKMSELNSLWTQYKKLVSF